jgi:anti-anti-sigma regulatory factor
MRRPKPKEESAIDVHGVAMSRRSPGAGETAGPQARAAAGPVHDFALALKQDGRGTAVLILGGELDLYRAPEIEDALARAIGPLPDSDRWEPTFDGRSGDDPQIPGQKVRRVAVDLCSVTFIDSTTLALLLAASRHQHAQGGELLVLVGPQTPMSAFEVTGIDRLLAIRRVEDDQGKGAA